MTSKIPPPPSSPPVNVDALPDELKQGKKFVFWRWKWKPDKKPRPGYTKPPFNPRTGRLASVSNPATWGTLDEALAANEKYHGDGIGFMTELDDKVTGIDLDHCRAATTEEIHPFAQQIVTTADSYTEITPSLDGLRIWIFGKLPPGFKHSRIFPDLNLNGNDPMKVEIFSDKRYFTLTGNHLPGTRETIESRQEELEEIHRGIFGTAPAPVPAPPSPPVETVASDEEVLERASKNEKFKSLWDGNTDGYGNDSSSADMGLCNFLAHWTGKNAAQMDRLFRRSGLMREKWDSKRGASTYGRDTIQNAIEAMKSVDLRPQIIVRQGRAPEATDRAEEILLEHARRLGIFQRAGEIVKVTRLRKARKHSGLKRPLGTLMLEPVTQPMLADTFDRFVSFQKWNAREKKDVPIDCPEKIVNSYLSRKGNWQLPYLFGVIAAPLLRPDGSPLLAQGYDEETELFLESQCEWLPLAEKPTQDNAKEAFEKLLAPLREFPFVSDADKAVAIAAILTALQRRLLGPCPLFGYSAPQPRSGKSLLAEAAAIIALGREAPASAVSSEGEELRKAFTASLREGHPIVNLDNIERPLKSSDLCKIITQEEWTDRLLGENSTLRLPTNCLWTATGNNLTFRGDLAQRVLLCRIDAKNPEPEQRSFAISNIKTHLLEHRAELIHAGLTILRAFHLAGRPKQECPIWGGFEDWTAQIREPLIWAGAADPFTTRKAAIAEDPEMEAATTAMQELARVFEDKSFTARKAADVANDEIVMEHRRRQYVDPELQAALSAITGEQNRKGVDVNRFGYWLRKWRDRFVGNLQLLRTNPDKDNEVAEWKIEKKST